MIKSTGILAIDIGGGTQDILLYDSTKTVENCFKLVLPSPTVVMAEQIGELTAGKRAIYLTGHLMGGGPVVRAVREHIVAGLAVYAHPKAAKTIKDDLAEVLKLGITITEEPPLGVSPVHMGDLQLKQLELALKPFGVRLPETIAIAAQDHGEKPGVSNRKFRFEMWRQFLMSGGALRSLLFQDVPEYLTRLKAIQEQAPGAYVMDTGSAAVWGALCDPMVDQHREQGVVVVNIGNQHALAFLLKGERIWGVFEHHTKRLNGSKLIEYVSRFVGGRVSDEEVFKDAGHGCWVHPEAPFNTEYQPFITVTGPNRRLVTEAGWHEAAPFGDMMLSGCFGLVAAIQAHSKSV